MEFLKLISIRRHMDYTNVNEKSEFQLNVGFWMGLLQVEVLQLSSFIRGLHFLHCEDEVSQFILLVLMLPLIKCFCDVWKEAYLHSTLVASHYIIII
jgi:hypothetical protein